MPKLSLNGSFYNTSQQLITIFMNFYTIPPVFNTPFAGLSRATPILSSHISRELINVISRALTISINRFQTQLQQPNNQSTVDSTAKLENKDNQIVSADFIEILSDDSQVIRKQLNLNKIEYNQKKIDIEHKENKKYANSSPLICHSSTNDDKLSEEANIQILKKSGKEKRKGQNQNQKKEVTFVVHIPEISQIQTCDIPVFGNFVDQLSNKRQQLLKRQVFEWVQKAKGRKQRRQIRMLGR